MNVNIVTVCNTAAKKSWKHRLTVRPRPQRQYIRLKFSAPCTHGVMITGASVHNVPAEKREEVEVACHQAHKGTIYLQSDTQS